ncbi:hypothetical protein HYPSUDRAFT_208407 [Hypholoma sublateritium FD-334 SS-4]|uniref:NACHT domain-containing protein n=1 Tax=Hypholoma sublateritium (strain FD-334 SS-4) TaxID=945553 RepID=A0A0D2LVC2_HYPSF|nr:hypothetical protein HYPSUDRAFT_208407 [Hypholoma sublateritium FD-334 SS-4]
MAAPTRNEMLRNAHGNNIRDSTLMQVNGDYHHNQYNQNHYNNFVSPEVRKQEALRRLFEHIAPGAFHDSAERRDPPKCHPHTREAVIRDILAWARKPANLRLLMWIYGPAGAGKSAIMQTIAEYCAHLGILGGSFFFFRSAEKRNITDHLIPTLAYQLSRRVPHFEDHLVTAILGDWAVFSRNMESQMKTLILGPMAAAAADNSHSSQSFYVMLVDGLDECQLEASHREVIDLLSSSASPHLRFIIASRPELAIRQSFSIPYVQNQTQTLALDDNYLPDNDIWRFLQDKFLDIQRTHMLRHLLPQDWPGSNIMDTLVHNSSGQFIYAATIIRYIESPRHSPIEHLATVLRAQLSPEQPDTPFALLDALYHQIFGAVADLTAVLDIFRVMLSDTHDKAEDAIILTKSS